MKIILHNIVKLYTGTVLLLLGLTLSAQSPVVYLNALRSDKLGSGDFERLHRDSKGCFWTSAKNSLCLLEGKTFKKYMFAPKEQSEYVNSELWGMPNGDIWFTTATGVYQYRYQTDSVYRISNASYILIHQQDTSSALVFDLQKNSVCRTDKSWRPIQYLGMSDVQSFRVVTSVSGRPEWLLSWKLTAMQKAGLYLKRLDGSVESSTTVLFDEKQSAYPPLHIHDVFVEDEHKIWIAAKEGLFLLNLTSPQTLVQYFPTLMDVRGIVKRKNGDYWMFAGQQGLLTFPDEPGATFKSVRTNDYAGFTTSRLGRMYLDEHEVLWMAFFGEGIAYTALPNSRFLIIDTEKALKTSGAMISTAAESADGNILIGTQGAGLLEWNRQTDEIRTLDLQGFDKNGRIFHLFNDAQRNSWVVTKKRLYKREPGQTSITPVSLRGQELSEPGFMLCHMTERNDGKLILSGDGKIFELDHEGTIAVLSNSDCNATHVTNSLAYKKGGLFVNSNYEKVLFNAADASPCQEIDAPYAEALCCDSHADSLVWIGCSKGLICYHVPSKQIVQPYHAFAGSLPPLYNISNLCSASDGRLWVTTLQSLFALDFQNGDFTTYSTPYGLIGDAFFKNTMFETSQHEIVVANSKVLYLLKPNQMHASNSPPPRIHLKNILVNDTPFVSRGNIELIESISRDYGEVISFEFTGVDYLMSDSLVLQYRLGGLDADGKWIDIERGATGFSRYAKLPPGDYVFHARVKDSTDSYSIKLHIYPPWYLTWWFIILAALSLGAVIYGIYLYRVAQIRKEAMLIQEKHTAELNALRAFINPHFLFNALNSINAFILTGRTDKANEYLGDFSRLMRLMLDHAQKSLVSLEEELNLIESYIFIEKRRFKYPFDYQVKIAEDLDVNQVLIPSMILQPYVENSIWHGLQHLQQPGGRIMIAVRKQDDFIEISIEDNGVGRTKAAEIKSRQVGRHKSQGLHLTRLRIEKTSTDNTVQTIDLFDAAGNAAGTRVVIRMKRVE